MADQFAQAGYGKGSVGWGTRPAVVAVDFQHAFCDPQYPIGRSPHVAAALSAAAPVFAAARKAG
ncbi:MAG TPA: hypothetical protein VLT59_04765, partial [Steroidobacteraceae bacterium]|nr:hypothetical protein [Steroidobacteraceae bacterium]